MLRCQLIKTESSNPHSPYYSKHMTAEEVIDFFAPEQSRIDLIMDWLTETGIVADRISLSINKQVRQQIAHFLPSNSYRFSRYIHSLLIIPSGFNLMLKHPRLRIFFTRTFSSMNILRRAQQALLLTSITYPRISRSMWTT